MSVVDADAAPLQRATGGFAIQARKAGERSSLVRLRQSGCCRVLVPRVRTPGVEAVLVNVSGGLAGGDRIVGGILCRAGAHLIVTTQASERIYGARAADRPTRIVTRCRIEAGARLDWLPHETIFYDGGVVARDLIVDMPSAATFLASECRVFGRVASGETVQRLVCRDRLAIRRDGIPALMENFRADGPFGALLSRRAVASGAGVMHTITMAAPDVARWLEEARACIAGAGPAVAGAASAWNDVLVVRLLGNEAMNVRQLARRITALLRGGYPAPVTWRLQ
nr:urease accessory protein UreD [Gluconacetobacter johannae]